MKHLKIILPAVIAVVALIAALIIGLSPSTVQPPIDDLSVRLSTAQQYLIELDYDRAIAEFEAVIQIDPMNVEAYLGLAKAYEGKGDTDKAIDVLEQGYAQTGEERLMKMLDSITGTANQTETTMAVTEETTMTQRSSIILENITTTTEETTSNVEPEVPVSAYEMKNGYVYINDCAIPTDIEELHLVSYQWEDAETGTPIIYEAEDFETSEHGEYNKQTNVDINKGYYYVGGSLEDYNFLYHFNSLKILTGVNELYDDIERNMGAFKYLAEYGNLEELSIEFAMPYMLNDDDYSFLEGFSSLKVLKVGMFDGNLDFLKNTPNLEKLTVYYPEMGRTYLENIEGLKYCPDLQMLDISRCVTYDCTPVEYCKKLRYLRLSSLSLKSEAFPEENYEALSDISFLSELTCLEKLDLSGNFIIDISPLKKLQNLKYLDLDCQSDNSNEKFKFALRDISVLSTLCNLKYLYLDQNSIHDFSPLSGLTNLEELFIYATDYSDTDDNQINSVQPFMNMLNLKKLYLGDVHFSSEDAEKLRERIPNCEIYMYLE